MTDKVYRVPYGTKDILPGEMKARRRVENAVIDIFDKWGYDEVKTPDFEYAEIYGSDGGGRDFCFFDRSGKLLTLRGDMTAPIARLAATRLQEGEQVKRLCYLADLYRYEEIQNGRQCEFTQAGVELLGAGGAAADAEIIAVAAAALRAAGVDDFTVMLGQAAFVEGIAADAGFSAEQTIRLKECLRRSDAVGLQALAASVSGACGELRRLIGDLLFLQGGVELLDTVEAELGASKAGSALEDLREIYRLLKIYGVEKQARFDLGLYRSFNYYTGMIFEIYLPGMGYSVAGGGRYDKMMENFGLDCPATGFAIGVDRVMLAPERRTSAENSRRSDIFLAWAEGCLDEAIVLASRLRSEGIGVKLAVSAMSREQARQLFEVCGCGSMRYLELQREA